MKRYALLAFLCLGAGPVVAGPRPLVAELGTCVALTPGLPYPADATAWFDASRQSQVVFYAQLLFPVHPLTSEEACLPSWHPPLVTGTAGTGTTVDHFYAQALWTDPKGATVALYGLTFTPRLAADHVMVAGRDYIPHTIAMAIGTRDLRAGAGQLQLPTAEGEYNVRLSVDGRDVGLAFFRMIAPSLVPPLSGPATLSPAAQAK